MDILFAVSYLGLIVIIAKAANYISSRRLEEEGHFGILTFDALYPGFNRRSEAEKYIKEKGWRKEEAYVVKLKEFLI